MSLSDDWNCLRSGFKWLKSYTVPVSSHSIRFLLLLFFPSQITYAPTPAPPQLITEEAHAVTKCPLFICCVFCCCFSLFCSLCLSVGGSFPTRNGVTVWVRQAIIPRQKSHWQNEPKVELVAVTAYPGSQRSPPVGRDTVSTAKGMSASIVSLLEMHGNICDIRKKRHFSNASICTVSVSVHSTVRTHTGCNWLTLTCQHPQQRIYVNTYASVVCGIIVYNLLLGVRQREWMNSSRKGIQFQPLNTFSSRKLSATVICSVLF